MSAPWDGDLRLEGGGSYLPDIEDGVGRTVAEAVDAEDGLALVHRANAYPKLVAELEVAVPLLQTLGAVALKSEVADHLPYGVLEEVRAWFRDRNPGAALASTREEG